MDIQLHGHSTTGNKLQPLHEAAKIILKGLTFRHPSGESVFQVGNISIRVYLGTTMSLAYWRDVCILNLPEIDQEHAELLRVLEAVYQNIQTGEDRHQLQAKLHYLFHVALSHCESEERLMESYNYPDAQDHADAHEELLNTVINLRLKAEEHRQEPTLDNIQDILAWLNHHFGDHDLRLVQFILHRRQRETLLFS